MVRERVEEAKGTRERILDVALDLFVEKGFDKTSLREIAAQLGFSKAALYYHFASKDDILLALHHRLHQLMFVDDGWPLGGQRITVGLWVTMLDGFIDKIPANRQLIALHERNRAAFEALHDKEHERVHGDLDEQLLAALEDPSIPGRQRVRMAVAFAGIMGGLLFSGDSLGGMSNEEMVDELKRAVHAVLEV